MLFRVQFHARLLNLSFVLAANNQYRLPAFFNSDLRMAQSTKQVPAAFMASLIMILMQSSGLSA